MTHQAELRLLPLPQRQVPQRIRVLGICACLLLGLCGCATAPTASEGTPLMGLDPLDNFQYIAVDEQGRVITTELLQTYPKDRNNGRH